MRLAAVIGQQKAGQMPISRRHPLPEGRNIDIQRPQRVMRAAQVPFGKVALLIAQGQAVGG